MIGDRRAPGQHERSALRRVLDLVRGVVEALLNPATVVSVPLVRLVARQRKRERRRLAASSHTGHVSEASPEPDPPSSRANPSTGDSSGTAGLAPCAASASPIGGTHTRSGIHAKRGELFSIVRVGPEFSPRVYAATFAALQVPPSAKLLDLTPARLFSADVFGRLAGAWTAPPGTVPRLGLLVSFERWVMLRETALAALQPLAARGVKVELFYEEQAFGGRLAAWFEHGQVVHNVPAVIATFAMRWQPSASWPMVIETLTRLVRAYACAAELPAMLTEIAGLALSCGGAEQAATHAREALYYLPEVPSATRGKALRELGAALMGQGQTAAGLALLDQAITMAAAVKDSAVGATALCQSGLYALNHGDDANAERRFRGAIDLLSPPTRRAHLLALAHHSLAIALMNQGKGEAEYHATTALALRGDPHSHLADEDRMLLSKLRDARAEMTERDTIQRRTSG